MSDETTIPLKQETPETVSHVEDVLLVSKRLHVSVRGFIGLLVVSTMCYMSLMGVKIEEPLYSMGLLVVGILFGQKKPRDPVNQ